MLKLPRTFRVGSSSSFLWQSPEALDTGLVPNVTFTVPELGFSQAMIHVTPNIVLASGGISADRTVLTAAIAPTASANLAKYGEAFVVTDEGESIAVRVVKIEGTSLTLAAPINDAVTLTGPNAYLQFSLWGAQFTPLDVTAVTNYRGLEYTVAYGKIFSGDGLLGSTDTGLLKVVRVPFETGLTHHKFVQWLPEFESVRHGQDDWSPQIEMAYIELAQCIESDVSEMVASAQAAGVRITVDDVQSQAAPLQQVHAYITASIIQSGQNQGEESDKYLDRAFGPINPIDLRRSTGLYEKAMKPVFIDANRDGIVIDTEIVSVTSPGPAFRTTGFSSTAIASVNRVR